MAPSSPAPATMPRSGFGIRRRAHWQACRERTPAVTTATTVFYRALRRNRAIAYLVSGPARSVLLNSTRAIAGCMDASIESCNPARACVCVCVCVCVCARARPQNRHRHPTHFTVPRLLDIHYYTTCLMKNKSNKMPPHNPLSTAKKITQTSQPPPLP